jgi:hypothetical protein
MTNPTMTPGDVEALLRELARRLNSSGVTAGIRVVGGAAISFMNPDRRATQDIDAMLHPVEPVRQIAALMAVERGLPHDWINDAAMAYVPLVGLEDWHEVLREGDVAVYVGSAQMLLAMKLFANRGRRDTTDIEFLLEKCQITSLEQAQEIYERYHAQDVITDAAAARVADWLDQR